MLAQQAAELAHELAADRAWHQPPGRERVGRRPDDGPDLVRRVGRDPGKLAAGHRRARDQLLAGLAFRLRQLDAEPGQ